MPWWHNSILPGLLLPSIPRFIQMAGLPACMIQKETPSSCGNLKKKLNPEQVSKLLQSVNAQGRRTASASRFKYSLREITTAPNCRVMAVSI